MFRFVTTFQKWHEKIGVFVVNLNSTYTVMVKLLTTEKKEKKKKSQSDDGSAITFKLTLLHLAVFWIEFLK